MYKERSSREEAGVVSQHNTMGAETISKHGRNLKSQTSRRKQLLYDSMRNVLMILVVLLGLNAGAQDKCYHSIDARSYFILINQFCHFHWENQFKGAICQSFGNVKKSTVSIYKITERFGEEEIATTPYNTITYSFDRQGRLTAAHNESGMNGFNHCKVNYSGNRLSSIIWYYNDGSQRYKDENVTDNNSDSYVEILNSNTLRCTNRSINGYNQKTTAYSYYYLDSYCTPIRYSYSNGGLNDSEEKLLTVLSRDKNGNITKAKGGGGYYEYTYEYYE